MLTSIVVYGQEIDYSYNYAKGYYFKLNSKEITTPYESYEIKNPSYENNCILMLPLNSLFSVAEQQTEIDYENGEFKVVFEDSILEINNNDSKMKIDGYEKLCMIPPVFKEDECYVAFNDILGIVNYDSINQIFALIVEEDFTDRIKNYVKEESKRHIYMAYVETNKFLKDGATIELDTVIYNKNGYLMLPVRTLFTSIYSDADVKWEADKKITDVITDKVCIKFLPGKNKILVDSKEISFSGSLDIKDSRLFIPLRILTSIQSLSDYDIYWDDVNKIAYLRT